MENKKYIIIIILLVISNIFFYFTYKQEKIDRLYQVEGVPNIELISAMSFYGTDMYNGKILYSNNPGDIAIGSITGFVAFPNIKDQPKAARQYYKIEATNRYDENGNQIFTLEETLKLAYIPPRAFEKEDLIVSSNLGGTLILKSEGGQIFTIDKRTDYVSSLDLDGDVTSLITKENEYQDFIFKLLE